MPLLIISTHVTPGRSGKKFCDETPDKYNMLAYILCKERLYKVITMYVYMCVCRRMDLSTTKGKLIAFGVAVGATCASLYAYNALTKKGRKKRKKRILSKVSPSKLLAVVSS
jgi:hypothetical protein